MPDSRSSDFPDVDARVGNRALENANDIGLEILGPLRELDEVAYPRFASVYSASRLQRVRSRYHRWRSGPHPSR